MKTRRFILIMLCGLMFCFCISCSSSASITAPIEVSAPDMWQEFLDDSAGAEKKYGGKTVTLTGSVSEIAESFMGSPCVLLENNSEKPPAGIFCFFSDLSSLSGLSVEDEVTIVGTLNIGVDIYGDEAPYIFIESDSITPLP